MNLREIAIELEEAAYSGQSVRIRGPKNENVGSGANIAGQVDSCGFV